MKDKNDALPPEVQAVIDAAREHERSHRETKERLNELGTMVGDCPCIVCETWRAYDASRAPRERYVGKWWEDTLEWVVVCDGKTIISCHESEYGAHRHAAWLNAAEHGELFTRAQVEELERAADRKAREECVKIASDTIECEGRNLVIRGVLSARAIRATIKEQP